MDRINDLTIHGGFKYLNPPRSISWLRPAVWAQQGVDKDQMPSIDFKIPAGEMGVSVGKVFTRLQHWLNTSSMEQDGASVVSFCRA